MSGIAGASGSHCYNFEVIGERMASSLRYCDEAIDLWSDSRAMLCCVHHEVSNIDPQPIVSTDGIRRIVFWGDLYNSDELRETLSCPLGGVDNDVELVLALVEERGTSFLGTSTAHLRSRYTMRKAANS